MKKLLALSFVVFALSWNVAQAEEFLECRITGQSDAVELAPSKILLSESAGWTLQEDGVDVTGFDINDRGRGILLGHSGLKHGRMVSYSYKFDDSQCENTQTATGTLVQRVYGSSIRVVSTYQCECAID